MKTGKKRAVYKREHELSNAAAITTAFFAAFALTALATKLVLRLLLARQVLDIPNARSSHTCPVPRGGGLGVMAGLLPVLAGAALLAGDTRPLWFAPGLVLLLAISWRDDQTSQSAWARLACQIAAIAFALGGLPADDFIFQGLMPFAADRVLTALAWLWFVNLTNFMDGIDGMTGIEMAAIGGGIVAVMLVAALPDQALTLYGAALAGAAAGFLVWNWHPAKLFLGDVGSVPLGYLAGGLLVLLAANGAFAAALILPAYYLADATLTLLWRLKRGDKIMRAHKEHWYQHAAARIGHAHTALVILSADALLVLAALYSLSQWAPALIAALAVVSLLLAYLSFVARRGM